MQDVTRGGTSGFIDAVGTGQSQVSAIFISRTDLLFKVTKALGYQPSPVIVLFEEEYTLSALDIAIPLGQLAAGVGKFVEVPSQGNLGADEKCSNQFVHSDFCLFVGLSLFFIV